MEPDWSTLHHDLLSQIALKLDSAEELIYFSVACRSWHRVFDMVKKKWTTKVMPWLMLPDCREDNPEFLRKIHSPSRQTSYLLKLPETFDRQCWGSSCGWLFTLGDDLECHLFNPLTKVRVRLPSQSTMPVQPEPHRGRPDWWIRFYYVNKVLTFYDDINDDFIVIAIYGKDRGYLTYARPHDQVWTPIITKISAYKKKKNIIALCEVPAIDAIRWGSQILILYHNGAIGSCDMTALKNSQPITVSEFAPPPLEILDLLRKGPYVLYLVELDGDLLMVLRYKYLPTPGEAVEYYETIDFEVYKLNFDTKTWEMLKDLGDVALFLGGNCSISVKASSIDKCKRNCIYFGDDEKVLLTATKKFGGHDMGCFYVETEEVEKVYKGDDMRTPYCGAFWFMPKF